jgi:hypothetical protein
MEPGVWDAKSGAPSFKRIAMALRAVPTVFAHHAVAG